MSDLKIDAFDFSAPPPPKATKTVPYGVIAVIGVLAVVVYLISTSFSRRDATPSPASNDIDRIAAILPSQMDAAELEANHVTLKNALATSGARQEAVQKLIDRIENEKAYRAR